MKKVHGDITRKDCALIFIVCLPLLVVGPDGWVLAGEIWAVVTASFASGLVILAMVLLTNRTRRLVFELARGSLEQVEALLSLHWPFQPRVPRPKARGWAASSGFLNTLCRIVFTKRPETVVGLGSGLPTLMTGHCLEKNGAGCPVSRDHDEVCPGKTTGLLEGHGPVGVATVVHAPLVRREIEGATWRWYETGGLALDSAIDLLVVDGPPKPTQALARYSALPLFRQHPRAGTMVVLDDGDRPDERGILEWWVREAGDPALECLDLEREAFFMKLYGR